MKSNNSAAEGRDAAWRVALRDAMPAKERTAIPRVKMPELSPQVRVRK